MATTDTERLRPEVLGDGPIDTSKAQRVAEGQSGNCDDVYAKQFAERHGYDLQRAYDIEFTSLLRPNIEHLEATPGDEDSVIAALNAAARRQKRALQWAAGELSFEHFLSDFGQYGTARLWGCIDASLIHDLGA